MVPEPSDTDWGTIGAVIVFFLMSISIILPWVLIGPGGRYYPITFALFETIGFFVVLIVSLLPIYSKEKILYRTGVRFVAMLFLLAMFAKTIYVILDTTGAPGSGIVVGIASIVTLLAATMYPVRRAVLRERIREESENDVGISTVDD